MSDCPMLISNKLHSFRNFTKQSTKITKCRFPPRINYQLDIKYKVKIEKNGNFGIRTNSCHFP